MEEILTKCYQLPWVEDDNPNGWIEPTTWCNLKCPGCYRGADKDDHKPIHLDFNEVIRQIDWYIAHRNIHTLSISGGDPLLYPRISDIVKYAASKKLRTMIYTNGVSLTKELLEELRDVGVTQVLLHIDRYQDRPDNPNKLTVPELQNQFCDLFRKVGGVLLGYIQPLSKDYCEEDIKLISDSALKNIDVVSLIVFTLYRDICWAEPLHNKISTDITIKQTIEAFKKIDDFVPASWLGSTNNKFDPTWVFGSRMADKKKKIGYFSPALYRFVHERYRKKKGRYMFISKSHRLHVSKLLTLVKHACIRKLFGHFLKSIFSFQKEKDLYFQSILLLRGPEKKNNHWDLCNGCPDRIIYNGRLVPSCILEDIKLNDNSNFKKVEFNSVKNKV